MTDQRERIVIEIDGTGARTGAQQVTDALSSVKRTADGTSPSIKGVGTASDGTGRSLGSMATNLRSVAAASAAVFGAMVGAKSALDFASLADQIQGVNARLKLSVGSQDAFNAAQARAYAISAQTGAGYEATATLLTRLSQVGAGYGLTQEQIATTTEVTAKALQLSGAAAAESSAVIRQLSQALGSGVLRGEEFNSIMENGPRLAKALADGLGLPIGKLRAMAEQGLLTTEVVTRALESQRGVLDAESANYTRTMSQAASHVSDEFGRMVDAANQWTGAGQGVAASMDYVANNMQTALGGVAVAAVAGLTVAVTKGGQAAVSAASQIIAANGQQLASTIALRQATVTAAEAEVASAAARKAAAAYYWDQVSAEQSLLAARAKLTTATTALTAAQAESSVVARGASLVVAGLGGPIGILTTLLTVGATAWAIWGREAEDAGDKAETAAEKGRAAMDRLRKAKSFGQDDLAPMRENVAAAEEALIDAKQKQADADAALKKAQDAAKSGGRTAQSIAMPFVAKGAVAAAEQNLARAKAELKEAEEIVKSLPGQSQQSTIGDSVGATEKAALEKRLKTRREILAEEVALMRKAQLDETKIRRYESEELAKIASQEATAAKRGGGAKVDLSGYGATRLAEIQASSQREMDILRARQAAESAAADAAYNAGLTSLETYYADRLRLIDAQSGAEISAQEKLIEAAQAEKSRLATVTPTGKNDSARIADQARDLDGKIADAQAKIEVLKIQADQTRAGAIADRAADMRARLSQEMQAAQAVINSTEQSLQSRVITGLETESTARSKLKDVIREQGETLERSLTPRINEALDAATDPARRAELQAMLDKIREMTSEAQTQTWTDGLKHGVEDYATSASDSFQTARDAATSAFSSMEDALVEFASTGKMSVSDMVTSMIADFARLAIRQSITQPLASGLSGVIGSLFGGGSSWSGAATTDASILGNSGFGLATGGIVSGPGNGTSDSIPTMLSNGEYVIKESVVRSHGKEFFDRINSGERPEFRALGGIVGKSDNIQPLPRMGNGKVGVASTGQSTPQAMNVRVEMVNQGQPQQVQSVTPKIDAEGMVLKIITSDLARNGPVARTMAGAYNLKRTV